MVAVIPFKKLEFDSKLNAKEIVSVLRNSITSLAWSQRAAKPFMGRVYAERFIVMRAIAAVRAGSQAVAYGKFLKIKGQTRVKVRIAFPLFTLFAYGSLLAGIGFFLPVAGLLLGLGNVLAFALSPLVVIAIYIFTMVLFNAESERLTKFLVDLLA